ELNGLIPTPANHEDTKITKRLPPRSFVTSWCTWRSRKQCSERAAVALIAFDRGVFRFYKVRHGIRRRGFVTDEPAGTRRPVHQESTGTDARRTGQGDGDYRSGHDVQPRHCRSHQSLRLAGQDVRQQAWGASEQDFDTWPERDRRRSLQGPKLARSEGMHRTRLLEDVARRSVDSR